MINLVILECSTIRIILDAIISSHIYGRLREASILQHLLFLIVLFFLETRGLIRGWILATMMLSTKEEDGK